MEVESQVHLYGHTGEVTSLFVCKPYSILISVSKDGTCILWDLNRSVCVRSEQKERTVRFLSRTFLNLKWSAAFVWPLSCSVSLQALLCTEPHRPQKPGNCGVCQRDHRWHRNCLWLRWSPQYGPFFLFFFFGPQCDLWPTILCIPVGGGSDLRLWTVNGDLIGHVHCREIICSVAFSNQPEGVSVNVIAGGLENGVVRWAETLHFTLMRFLIFSRC